MSKKRVILKHKSDFMGPKKTYFILCFFIMLLFKDGFIKIFSKCAVAKLKIARCCSLKKNG